jgi:hypothetical protein
VIGQQSLASHLQLLRHERQRRIRPAQVGTRTVKDLDSTEIRIGIYITYCLVALLDQGKDLVLKSFENNQLINFN